MNFEQLPQAKRTRGLKVADRCARLIKLIFHKFWKNMTAGFTQLEEDVWTFDEVERH